jgi:hypothetical protein
VWLLTPDSLLTPDTPLSPAEEIGSELSGGSVGGSSTTGDLTGEEQEFFGASFGSSVDTGALLNPPPPLTADDAVTGNYR